MLLTEEQLQKVEELAGCNYTVRQIAMFLDIPVDELYEHYQDIESEFRYHYDRGQLINHAEVDIKLLQDAKAGNLTASAQFKKAAKLTRLNNLKHELFGI
jgi:hypothetical protein